MTYFSVSVDVEEDLPGILPHGVRGIEDGLPALLQILDDLEIRADFFFLASIATEYPEVVRDVVSRGHGVGNHGLDHSLLCEKPVEVQRRAVQASTRVLTAIAGVRPMMFRAPNFSVNHLTLDMLAHEGYLIDSSVLPGRFLRRRFRTVYDHRGAPIGPYHPLSGDSDSKPLRLVEIPVTGNPLRPGAPIGLGALNAYGSGRLSEITRNPEGPVVVFLIHPWELIDLASNYPAVPSGYALACSSNLQPLRAFLNQSKGAFTFTTLNKVAIPGGTAG